MLATDPVVCSSCGRQSMPGSPACTLCGHLFQTAQRKLPALPTRPEPPPDPAVAERARLEERRDLLRRAEPWLHLAGGVALAPVFTLLPVFSHMGWFLASLAHEMGHSAVAWFFGQPAVPAISLDGHAAAVHGEQMLALCVAVLAVLGTAVWKLVHSRPHRLGALCGLTALYALLGFTKAKEVLFLFGGHGGELLFAAVFLWRALEPGFTRFRAERTLYAALGWMLIGRNFFLALGLVSSAAKRQEYAENGSFGFTNDYLRLANEVLGVPLMSVASLMTIASVATPLVAIGGWRLHVFLRERQLARAGRNR